MTITTRPRWSLGHGKPLVPSSWQATLTSQGHHDVAHRVRTRAQAGLLNVTLRGNILEAANG